MAGCTKNGKPDGHEPLQPSGVREEVGARPTSQEPPASHAHSNSLARVQPISAQFTHRYAVRRAVRLIEAHRLQISPWQGVSGASPWRRVVSCRRPVASCSEYACALPGRAPGSLVSVAYARVPPLHPWAREECTHSSRTPIRVVNVLLDKPDRRQAGGRADRRRPDAEAHGEGEDKVLPAGARGSMPVVEPVVRCLAF